MVVGGVKYVNIELRMEHFVIFENHIRKQKPVNALLKAHHDGADACHESKMSLRRQSLRNATQRHVLRNVVLNAFDIVTMPNVMSFKTLLLRLSSGRILAPTKPRF